MEMILHLSQSHDIKSLIKVNSRELLTAPLQHHKMCHVTDRHHFSVLPPLGTFYSFLHLSAIQRITALGIPKFIHRR